MAQKKAKTIAMGGSKGGIGKSTLAANFAAHLAVLGFKVCGVDADKQMTFEQFWQQRSANDDLPFFTMTALRAKMDDGRSPVERTKGFRQSIESLKESYDWIIIDAPGADVPEQGASMLLADACISPVGPGNFSIWAAGKDFSKMADIRTVRPELPIFIIPNNIDALPNIANKQLDGLDATIKDAALGEGLLYTRELYITARPVWNWSTSHGMSVTEVAGIEPSKSNKNAAEEFLRLFDAVTQSINNQGE